MFTSLRLYSVVFLMASVLFGCANHAPSPGLNTSETEHKSLELQAITYEVGQVSAVYRAYMEVLLTSTDALLMNIDASQAEAMSAQNIQAIEIKIAESRQGYNAAQRQAKDYLATPIRVYDPAIRRKIEAYRTFIKSLDPALLGFLQDAEATVQQLAATGTIDANAQMILYFRRTMLLLEGENVLLQTGLHGIRPDHPQGPLGSAIISGNKAFGKIYESLAKLLEGAPSEVALQLLATARTDIRQTELEIQRGYEYLDAYQQKTQLARLAAQGQRDIQLAGLTDALLATYVESFEVETRITQVALIMINSIEQDSADDATWDAIDAAISELVDRRMALQDDRVKIAGQIAVAAR